MQKHLERRKSDITTTSDYEKYLQNEMKEALESITGVAGCESCDLRRCFGKKRI